MQPVSQLGPLLYFLEENRRIAGREAPPGPHARSSVRKFAARVMIRIGVWLEPETPWPGRGPTGQPSAQGVHR